MCFVAAAPQINWIISAKLSFVLTCTDCQVDNSWDFLPFTLLTLCLWFSTVHMHMERGAWTCKRGRPHKRMEVGAGTSGLICHEKNQQLKKNHLDICSCLELLQTQMTS